METSTRWRAFTFTVTSVVVNFEKPVCSHGDGVAAYFDVEEIVVAVLRRS